MILRWTRICTVLLAAWLVLPVLAQDDVASAPDTPDVPQSTMLEGFSWIHQGTNRCSAAALTIHLSYYEPVNVDTYRTLATQTLNTYGADASVRIEEMAAAAEARGLNAIVRRGGTVDLLRELVAGGFPVLVENSYYEGSDVFRDWLSHNRVLVGYDDATQTFSFQDSLLGYPEGDIVTYNYDDLDRRWQPFNRDYLVIYRDDEADDLQAILGENHWELEANAQWTLQQAQAEIDAGEGDQLRYSYYNRGWAQVQLGEYEAAAESFDMALANDNMVELGTRLPLRYLWYDFAPFEAYLQVGRYQDALDLVRREITNAGDAISVEEWYYYAGRAHEGLGNLDRARTNYEIAVFRNSNFEAAQDRLTQLNGG